MFRCRSLPNKRTNRLEWLRARERESIPWKSTNYIQSGGRPKIVSMAKIDIHFGAAKHWHLQYDGQVCSPSIEVRGHRDLTGQVRKALANPLDFPSFEQAIVPGDRVALVVDPLLPSMAEIVTACVRYLIDKGVTSDQLAIVLAGHEPEDARLLQTALEVFGESSIPIELHDADDSTRIAYVAANDDSNPIYMNRTVVDADVILPITCARGRSTLDYLGAYSVFPLLSNRATRGEFFSLEKLDAVNEHHKLTAWADQAAWWVGLMFIVQAIPAPDQQIASVLAGSPSSVEPEVQELMTKHWQIEEQSAEVVIAMLEGGPSQQTWENLARALHTAKQLVAHDGAIVLCTEIEKSPGEGLQKLRSVHNSTDAIARKLAHNAADDALAAAVILEATKDCHVYLISNLKTETVEGLGMGSIRDAVQLEHLLQQHHSCYILAAAQHRCLATKL
jgi:nickel-dependent lactate racemase